jgi:hypothetical protein
MAGRRARTASRRVEPSTVSLLAFPCRARRPRLRGDVTGSSSALGAVRGVRRRLSACFWTNVSGPSSFEASRRCQAGPASAAAPNGCSVSVPRPPRPTSQHRGSLSRVPPRSGPIPPREWSRPGASGRERFRVGAIRSSARTHGPACFQGFRLPWPPRSSPVHPAQITREKAKFSWSEAACATSVPPRDGKGDSSRPCGRARKGSPKPSRTASASRTYRSVVP